MQPIHNPHIGPRHPAHGWLCPSPVRRLDAGPGLASGISGGADGSVWTIGRNGKRVYRVASDWSSVKHSFDEKGRNLVIAVCADNRSWPYVVTRSQEIFRKQGARLEDKWQKVPGFATNLGAGLDGSLWTVGKSGKRVFKLAPDGTGTKHSFDEQGTDPIVAVAADALGNPVVVTRAKKIFKEVGAGGSRSRELL